MVHLILKVENVTNDPCSGFCRSGSHMQYKQDGKWPRGWGVTSIVTCTPCATAKMSKKSTFFMVRHDMRVPHLGYQKHFKKSEKRISKLICKIRWKGRLINEISNAGFRLTCRSPLCRYAAWSSLAVSELQPSAATPLWLFTERQSLQSWIEFNCLRSAVVGKAARLSIYWLDAACRLVIPLRQVTLAQLK